MTGTGLGKWDQVQYSRLFGDLDEFRVGQDAGDSDEEYGSHDERLNIGRLAAFPRPETFVLGQGSLLIDTSKQAQSLPYLRRLVIFGETEIENPESNPPIFSSVNTPNLTSLTLDETDVDYQGFELTFCRIFSQSSTLVIQDFGRRRSFLNYLDKLRNLRHLSID